MDLVMMVALFIFCWWNCQNSIAVLQMTRAGFLAELSAVWKLKLHCCLKWLAAALFLFILSNLKMDSHTHYSNKMTLPHRIQINIRKSRETKTNTLQLFRIVWWEKWSIKERVLLECCKMQTDFLRWCCFMYSCTFVSVRIWMHGDIYNISCTLSTVGQPTVQV